MARANSYGGVVVVVFLLPLGDAKGPPDGVMTRFEVMWPPPSRAVSSFRFECRFEQQNAVRLPIDSYEAPFFASLDQESAEISF